ncbi:MAG TPA: hypothetical protein PLY86_20375 [bacterium]|nr:hypothetical protein [bacterium]
MDVDDVVRQRRSDLCSEEMACGERDAGKGAISAGGRPLWRGVCDERISVFNSMIFASGKNAGMALEDSRGKNKVKDIVWRSLRSRKKKKKDWSERGVGDPIEIFFYQRQAVLC